MTEKIDISKIESFGKIDLIAKQVVEGFITGLHKSPFHGFSVEFAEHRLYNTGESTKHLDWKLYARTDKLFVKRYEEETNLRAQIVIDCSNSMYFPEIDKKNSFVNTKIGFSIYAAAALSYLLKKQRDAVGLSLFSDKIQLHTPQKSTNSHVDYIFHELEKISQTPEIKQNTDTASALHQIAELVHKRSLIIIFSDMFDNINENEKVFSALQHLRHNKHEVLLFHVLDKLKESYFIFEDKPHRFIDLESGEELKLNPAEIRKQYTTAIQKHSKEIKLKCAQYSIDYIEVDINEDFNEVLYPYLLKRKRMF
ncbi:MAG: DUF58 domain-containing protein [Bacteroidota bacterium]